MRAGWQQKSIGDVCEVVNGGTPKTDISEYWNGKHLWITPAEMGNRPTPYVSDTVRKLSDSGLRDCSARILPPFSVILSSRAPIGHLAINAKPMSTNQGCKGLVPMEGLEHKFLYYYLTSMVEVLGSLGTGATFPELSGARLKEVSISVPPLAEQRRIIRLLDEALANLAAATASAEKNLKSARALFECHLQGVFSRTIEMATQRRLGDLAEIQTGGTPPVSNKEFWGGEIPWYSSGELNATLTSEPERNISRAGLAHSNAKLFPKGSLLIGMYDTAALKMSILDRDGAFNQAIAGIKPNEKLDLEFVLYAISARKPQLLLERRGVRQKNLSLGKIKDIVIPVPTLDRQRAIVAELRAMASQTRRLENLYQKKLKALSDLKMSLLHQAFSGAL